MDVVHLAAVFLQVAVQEVLQGAHGQLGGGVGHGDGPPLPGQDVGELVALALAGVGAGIGGQQVGQQLLGVHPKDHPVDGLKLQGVVVEVHQLHQGIPGGWGLLLLGERGGLELFPAGLGGGQEWFPSPMA